MANAITMENAIVDGRMPSSYWDVDHSREIEGFATDISINAGDQVDFKINVADQPGSDYMVEIFRLGYYGGDGARKVGEWVNTSATVQPDALYDPSRALVDAGNWSVTDSWQVPTDAVSGVYLARLQRLDANGDPIDGAVNQIPFIVREDDRAADIVLQTSDTTWQAYNGWFGNNGQIGANFYGDASGTVDHPDIPGAGSFAQDRAYAVSYNRPFITRGIDGEAGGPASGPQDYLFGADYAAISWLEQHGYDVAYISGVDTDRLGADYLEKYGAFISVGHDEYWSGPQRGNVEAARDAGVNLLFWSGNEIYWKTRWEGSIADGDDYRTLVCYKETWAHADPNAGPQDYYNLDPSDIWTGTWRDTRFLDNPLAGGTESGDGTTGQVAYCHCAENALIGQLFGPDGTGEFAPLDVPQEYSTLRVWRDTSIANGGAVDLANGILGYEWDTSPEDENRPAGLIKLSETTVDWSAILVDDGNTTEPGTAVHNLSLYRAESGALVFGAGTVFWSWALSDEHDSSPYGASIANTDLQQFNVNLFADMGIQPGVSDAELALAGLVRAAASTDVVAATTTLQGVPATTSAFTPITITGTATDDDGNAATSDGIVALVEVSVDGGETWRVANGKSDWSFTWVPVVTGTYEIVARAIDDSLNLPDPVELVRATVDVVQPPQPEVISLFDPVTTVTGTLQNDFTTVELGMRFVVAESGYITQLKYWRAAADADDTDVRSGHLWDANGNLLATVTFTSNPGEAGWQTASLDTPVAVLPSSEYTVSYRTQDNYFASTNFFAADYVDPYGKIAALAGSNGVYQYGSALVAPTNTYNASNYWVDVGFDADQVPNAPPTFTSGPDFQIVEGQSIAALVKAVDTGGSVTYSIAGGADAALFDIDPLNGLVTFKAPPDFEAPADAGGNNVYDVIAGASDGVTTTQQNISITVGNYDDSGLVSSIFAISDTPATIITDDSSGYELGAKFLASGDGLVGELRYYRGAVDAGDTDVRTLNLWSEGGTLLGSVVVQSDPGDIGWQIGQLATPVALTAGTVYVVSYGTSDNFAFSANTFDTDRVGAGGVVTAPASGSVGGNGVLSAAGPGVFPTETFQAANYWVDVGYVLTPESNTAPVFTSAGAFDVAEGSRVVGVMAASDADGNALTYAIAGGADADAFLLDPSTGVLSFATAPDFETPTDANANNVYDVIVSVSDGIAPAVQQSVAVSVQDVDESLYLTGLFDETVTPAAIETNDPVDYELGMKFTVNRDGLVWNLSYYRGAVDANDTDLRTLNLWDSSGNILASVDKQSLVGEVGWQTANLASPVALTAGETYVVSYGTTQNYAFQSHFFDTAQSGDDGIVTGLASGASGGNGVYAANAVGAFPTQTYQASNYFVDIGFAPDPGSLTPPTFTSPSAFTMAENQTIVGTATAADAENDPLLFAIDGGADAGLFQINASSGVLSFLSAPDFETPLDAGANNVYDVRLSVSDGLGTALQDVTVAVTDVDETTPLSTIFGPSDAPALTVTNDTTDYELGMKFRADRDGVVSTLQYFRGTADAGDTDTRTLNLWAEDGTKLASVSVVSQSGDDGWQVGYLNTPVAITADTTYLVSYGTTDNYVATNNYFTTSDFSDDGILFGPADGLYGGNGVFSTGGPGTLPTQTYLASNYWVDIGFIPDELLV